MKRILFIICIASIGCTTKSPKQIQEDLTKRVRPVVTQYVSSLKMGHIDSLNIYKIDTLTPQTVEIIKGGEYGYLQQKVQDEFDKVLEKGKYHKRMLDISYSTYDYNSLEDIKVKAKSLLDEITMYDSLKKVCFKTADTMKSNIFLGYVVRFNLKYSDSLTLVQNSLDSADVILTPDFKVKEKESFIAKKL